MALCLLRILSMALLACIACVQPTCPGLTMQVQAGRKAAVGGTVTVKTKVRNAGATRQQDMAIGITLPDSVWSPLRPVTTAVKQQGALDIPVKYQSPGVYWLPLSFPAGKGVPVRVKAKVAACAALAGTTLAFSGIVYKTNPTGDVTCATAATCRTVTTVKARSPLAKTAPPSVCSSALPIAGYEIYMNGLVKHLHCGLYLRGGVAHTPPSPRCCLSIAPSAAEHPLLMGGA
jgi:hypothetical protein